MCTGLETGLEKPVHEGLNKHEEAVTGSGRKEILLCSGGKLSNIDTHGNLENRKCTNELCDLAKDTSRHNATSATWPPPAAYNKMREYKDKLKNKHLTIKVTGPAEFKNKMVSHSQMANQVRNGFWIWF